MEANKQTRSDNNMTTYSLTIDLAYNVMTTLTAREIRKRLFDCNKHAVIGTEEMTNSEARLWLYNLDDQDQKFFVFEEPTHFIIFSPIK